MSISQRFMDMARDRLSKEVFDQIYADAVHNEREAVLVKPVLPAAEQIKKPSAEKIMTAHINNQPIPVPVPHVVERMEERFDTIIGPNEMGILSRMILNGDSNVHIIKRRFDTILECEISFMGKHFICLYNQSRKSFITVYPKKKRKPKHKVSKPSDNWRKQIQEELEDG